MNPLDKTALALFIWGAVLSIANPWFENKKMVIAATGCFIAATIAFIVS